MNCSQFDAQKLIATRKMKKSLRYKVIKKRKGLKTRMT